MRGFKQAFSRLPADKQETVKNKIMAVCGWTTYIQWQHKKGGHAILLASEKENVIKEFSRYNINAKTGMYINPSIMPEAYLQPIETR